MREVELFIGPNHPGIPGNYSVKLVIEGDTILDAYPQAGYLHRGFEKLMERRMWVQNIAIAPRICVPEPDINEVAYSMAVEYLAGIEVPKRAQYIRMIVLELARLASYLFGIGGVAGALGLYSLPHWSTGDRDYILDIFENLTGARVYHIYTTPGGVRRDINLEIINQIKDFLDYLEKRMKDYDKLFFFNSLVIKRTKGIGILNKEYCLKNGASGPVIKAAGVPKDLRKDEPYLCYDEFDFEIPVRQSGDAYDRVAVIRDEMFLSIRLLREIVDNIPGGKYNVKLPVPFKFRVPPGDYYAKVESSRGEYGYYVVSNGDIKPYRVNVRGPSYTHGVHILRDLLRGQNIADASMLMFSVNLCPPEIDR